MSGLASQNAGGAQPHFVLRHAGDARKVQTGRHLAKGWLGSAEEGSGDA